MRQLFVFVALNFTLSSILFAQTATLRGTVKDGKTGELLEGANVVQPPANGTTTDVKGNYELKVTAGEVTLIVSYIGMNPDTLRTTVKDGEVKTFNVGLGGSPVELQQVVIGESKIAVKIQKITQSVDVMKPRMVEGSNITHA